MISVQQLHVLVIDDNEDILFMLQAMLQHKGYKVSVKENPNGIKETIQNISPDIILMDMLLSGADGREICQQLKSDPDFSEIPVIMLSAHPQARVECLAAGANYFIEKPFEMSELINTVAIAEKSIMDKK